MCAQLEELKLFSTAERLGLLSTLERLLVSDPAAVSSLALVPFIGTVGKSDKNVADIVTHQSAKSTRLPVEMPVGGYSCNAI